MSTAVATTAPIQAGRVDDARSNSAQVTTARAQPTTTPVGTAAFQLLSCPSDALKLERHWGGLTSTNVASAPANRAATADRDARTVGVTDPTLPGAQRVPAATTLSVIAAVRANSVTSVRHHQLTLGSVLCCGQLAAG